MNEPVSRNRRDPEKQHEDEELDEALEETFPASDPIEPAQPGGEDHPNNRG